MSALSVHEHYSNLEAVYELDNNDQVDSFEFTQFNTVVTNRLFTPDNETTGTPEDLQLRVSQDVKLFVGENDTAANGAYTLRVRDEANAAILDTQRDTLTLSAEYLGMNSLTVHDNANTLRLSAEKVLQLHSGNKIEMMSKVEFSNDMQVKENLFVGKSLVFGEDSYGSDSNDQVRIALQYNESKDTLDIVKQKGDGGESVRSLMARFGLGSVSTNDTSLDDVPYYQSPSVTTDEYSVDASVHNASNIWNQQANTLYYGTGLNQRVGIGVSNVNSDQILLVEGAAKINNVRITEDNIITGVKNLTADSLTLNSNLIINNLDVSGNTSAEHINVDSINFKNNNVSVFDGTTSTLSNDEWPWLKADQGDVSILGFRDVTMSTGVTTLQETAIDTLNDGKWRFKESNDDLLVEKYDASTSNWTIKFRFE